MVRTMLAITFALLLSLGAAVAEGSSEDDVYLRVDDPLLEEVAEDLHAGELGDELYDVQEGVHDAVTETTGEEIEHYYIHVCFGSQCLPIDPLRVSN